MSWRGGGGINCSISKGQQTAAAAAAQDSVLPAIINRLKDHVLDLCQQKFSSNVLEKLLTTSPEPHKQVLIEGVIAAGKKDTGNVAEHLLFHQYCVVGE